MDAIFDAKVPKHWVNDLSGAEISWIKPSLPLWFNSLLERNQQLTNWLKSERPKIFNLGGFFNPQGFLTAMKQEVVRMNKNAKHAPGSKGANENWSMEAVEYTSSVLKNKDQANLENLKEAPGEGVYLGGCRWSNEKLGLDECMEKKMIYPLNVLHVSATATSSRRGQESERREKAYNCPVYKYPMRGDRYLIFRVLLPCIGGNADASKWKLRGVALLCSID